MADTLTDPSFLEHEVAEQKAVIEVEIEDAAMNCNNLTTEVMPFALNSRKKESLT